MQLSLNITSEYKYYILMCGIFAPSRNIVKFWSKYEPAFLRLVKDDGKLGPKRLFQAIVLYFIVKYPEQQKWSNTFMRTLYDQSVFSD